MDNKRIEMYILFLVKNFNIPQNEFELEMKKYVDNWRKDQAMKFILSVTDDEIFSLLKSLFDSNTKLVNHFKASAWYHDDQCMYDLVIDPLKNKMITPMELYYIAKFIRIVYFPEFIIANNNLDIDSSIRTFKDIYLLEHARLNYNKKQIIPEEAPLN